MHKLSDIQIRNAKAKDKEYSLGDGAGLHYDKKNGSKIWVLITPTRSPKNVKI